MLVTVGSVSNLKNGKMEDVEIQAVFKNLDFNATDFEEQLAIGLQKVGEEILLHRNLIFEATTRNLPGSVTLSSSAEFLNPNIDE